MPASEVDGSTTVNVGGFNLCARRYSFTVAPVTREGTGPTSASVDRGIPGILTFFPLFIILQELYACPSLFHLLCKVGCVRKY